MQFFLQVATSVSPYSIHSRLLAAHGQKPTVRRKMDGYVAKPPFLFVYLLQLKL